MAASLRMVKRLVKQWNAPKGIDARTLTRFATEEEREKAREMLRDLEENYLKVGLVPAKAQNFEGHMVRAVENENPEWYREFVKVTNYQVKRLRVIRALKRVIAGRVRGNGYENDLLRVPWPKKHGSS